MFAPKWYFQVFHALLVINCSWRLCRTPYVGAMYIFLAVDRSKFGLKVFVVCIDIHVLNVIAWIIRNVWFQLGICMVTYSVVRVIDKKQRIFMPSEAYKIIEVLPTAQNATHELILSQKPPRNTEKNTEKTCRLGSTWACVSGNFRSL